jgi:ABC-type Fe3+/spermidine/putrescine transport system ATPase subunit
MPAVISGPGEVRLDHGPSVAVASDGLAPGERCHAVVRPEKLRIEPLGATGAGASPNGDAPRVEGTVESSLYLGTSTQVVVDLGDGVRMTVLVPNADEAQRQQLPGGGARVALSWDPEHMHLVGESPQLQRGESDEGESDEDS